MLDLAYQALGVSSDDSPQEIKRAYRRLMSQYHPDKLIAQGELIVTEFEGQKFYKMIFFKIRSNNIIGFLPASG